jgi:hypothetical protein
MAAGEMDKDEFCKEYKKCGSSRLFVELFRAVCTLEDRCDGLQKRVEIVSEAREKEMVEICDTLLYVHQAIVSDTLYDLAVEKVGRRSVIARKRILGLTVTDDEIDFLLKDK